MAFDPLNPYRNTTTSVGTNAYLGQSNPFLNDAINFTSGDITRNFNNTVNPQFDRMARASGSFGNSGVEQARADAQRNMAQEVGRASSNMRMQDYGLQAQLGEGDLNRRMTAGLADSQRGLDAYRADQTYSLGQDNLAAVNQRNANDFTLGTGNLDATRQRDANAFTLGTGNLAATNRGIDNTFTLGQGNLAATNRGIDNTFDLGNRRLGLDTTTGNRNFEIQQGNLAATNTRNANDLILGNGQLEVGRGNTALGYANLDRGIANDNFNNNLAGANFGLSVYNTLQNGNGTAINTGTAIQNAPMSYFTNFSNGANSMGNGGGTTSGTSTLGGGNPVMQAVGGATAFGPGINERIRGPSSFSPTTGWGSGANYGYQDLGQSF